MGVYPKLLFGVYHMIYLRRVHQILFFFQSVFFFTATTFLIAGFCLILSITLKKNLYVNSFYSLHMTRKGQPFYYMSFLFLFLFSFFTNVFFLTIQRHSIADFDIFTGYFFLKHIMVGKMADNTLIRSFLS